MIYTVFILELERLYKILKYYKKNFIFYNIIKRILKMSRSKKMKAVSSEVGKTSLGTTILSTTSQVGIPSLEEKRKFCSNQKNDFKSDILKDRSEIIKMFSYDDNDLTIVITDKYAYINPYLTENLNAPSNRSIAMLDVFLIPLNTILADGQIVFYESSFCTSYIYNENMVNEPSRFKLSCCKVDIPIINMNNGPTDVVSKYRSNVGNYNGSNYDIYVRILPYDNAGYKTSACYIRAPV